MTTIQDIERATHEWSKKAVLFAGRILSEATLKGDDISYCLRLRWYFRKTWRGQILPRDFADLSLDKWVIDNHDPFIFDVLTRHHSIEVVERCERIIVSYFPNISIDQCHRCGQKIGLSNVDDGRMICNECKSDANRQKSGYVYMFGNADYGLYKIGSSRRPPNRMRDYRNSQLPFDVEMIHTIPADNQDMAERDFHERYNNARTNGEWFRLSSEQVDLFKRIKRFKNNHCLMN